MKDILRRHWPLSVTVYFAIVLLGVTYTCRLLETTPTVVSTWDLWVSNLVFASGIGLILSAGVTILAQVLPGFPEKKTHGYYHHALILRDSAEGEE